MAAGADAPAVPPVNPATTHAMPLVASQRIDPLLQRVMDRDIQTVLIHHCHQMAEIMAVVRPAFPDVKLPLMDHLMGQSPEDF